MMVSCSALANYRYRRRLPLGKGDIHSAKLLSSVTLGKRRSINSLSAKTSLPNAFYRALGKGFAECQSDTRQRKVAVTASATMTATLPSVKVKHSAKVPALSSAVDLDTRQRWSLCRVPPVRHSAKYVMFAECLSRGTRQISDVCRVQRPLHSTKHVPR